MVPLVKIKIYFAGQTAPLLYSYNPQFLPLGVEFTKIVSEQTPTS